MPRKRLALKLEIVDSDAADEVPAKGDGDEARPAGGAVGGGDGAVELVTPKELGLEKGGTGEEGGAMKKTGSFKMTQDAFTAGGVRVDEKGIQDLGKSAPSKGMPSAVAEATSRMASEGGREGETAALASATGSAALSAYNRAERIPLDALERVRRLGAGASSVVYLCREPKSGRLVAVKSISLYVKAMRDMLLHELSALHAADCATLVRFFGARYSEGQVSVALEFMNVGGFDEVIRKAKGAIPERVVAAAAFQVLWALSYLMASRKIHRDIKPANILVNSEGEVKVTDFGLSKDVATAVLAQTFVGTFKYMAPERMLSQPYGFSSDIWAVGLCLYEALTGTYPLDAGAGASTIDAVTAVTEGESPDLDCDLAASALYKNLTPEDWPDVYLVPREEEGGEEGGGGGGGGEGDEKESGEKTIDETSTFPPGLVPSFTDEAVDFIALTLKKDPKERPHAVALLDHPWFRRWEVDHLDAAARVVRKWLIRTNIVET